MYKTLTCTGKYKDDGSIGLIDREGNEYYQNFAFKDRDTELYGKIIKGNINKQSGIITKGIFTIVSGIIVIDTINQSEVEYEDEENN